MKNIFLAIPFLFSSVVFAHDGPVNDAGCHKNEDSAGMHCHNERRKKVKTVLDEGGNAGTDKSHGASDVNSLESIYSKRSDLTRIKGGVLFKEVNSGKDGRYVVLNQAYSKHELIHILKHIDAKNNVFFYLGKDVDKAYAYLREYRPIDKPYEKEVDESISSKKVYASFNGIEIVFNSPE